MHSLWRWILFIVCTKSSFYFIFPFHFYEISYVDFWKLMKVNFLFWWLSDIWVLFKGWTKNFHLESYSCWWHFYSELDFMWFYTNYIWFIVYMTLNGILACCIMISYINFKGNTMITSHIYTWLRYKHTTRRRNKPPFLFILRHKTFNSMLLISNH